MNENVLDTIMKGITIGSHYIGDDGDEYKLHGVLVTDEDYYYSLENTHTNRFRFISTVVDLEMIGFERRYI